MSKGFARFFGRLSTLAPVVTRGFYFFFGELSKRSFGRARRLPRLFTQEQLRMRMLCHSGSAEFSSKKHASLSVGNNPRRIQFLCAVWLRRLSVFVRERGAPPFIRWRRRVHGEAQRLRKTRRASLDQERRLCVPCLHSGLLQFLCEVEGPPALPPTSPPFGRAPPTRPGEGRVSSAVREGFAVSVKTKAALHFCASRSEVSRSAAAA